MPCGLVLPAASGKLVDAACEPLMVRCSRIILINSIGAVVHDPDVADSGRVDRQTGRAAGSVLNRPAPEQRAGDVVLEHLIIGGVVDDPETRAIRDDAHRVAVAAAQVEAAGRGLRAGETSGRAGVSEHLVLLAIDDPDIGAIGGDAFHRGIRRETASTP